MQKSFTAERIFWKIMKWFGIQGALMIMTCFMAIAHDNYGQILDRKISITVENVPLNEAIEKIEGLAKIRIFYSIDHIEFKSRVSFSANSQSLKYVLDKLLSPIRIEYTVFENDETITLRRMSDADTTIRQQSQKIKVRLLTGVVRNPNNEPLPGVNIVVKGSARGTATDANGAYGIQVNDGEILNFSFIGYKPVEVPVNGQASLDIVLEEDVASLSEVIVNAGYYNVDEKERTGNISRVSGDVISQQPVSNPLAALEGRMPGVYIQQNSGLPGGGFTIQIRGKNSLRSDGNSPLYVVDGVPFTPTSLASPLIGGSILMDGSPLSTINPNDIESIEVLKDADATAIYGSRGANGVVLITTKKGKQGKTRFNLNVSEGFGQVGHMLKLLNSTQYRQLRLEALKNDGYSSLLSDPSFDEIWPDLKTWDSTRYTNWQKKLIGGFAQTTNAQGTLSGGNANTQFSFGGAYYRETTVFPGNFNFQRGSANLNVNHVSDNKKLKANISVNYSSSLNKLLSIDLTSTAVTLSPNAPALYDAKGQINADWQNGTIQNPLLGLQRKYRNSTDNLISNASLSYEIIDGLRVKSNLGYTTMQVNEFTTTPLSSIPPQFVQGQTGSAYFGDSFIKTWIAEPQAEYNKAFSSGNLTVLAGSTFQQSTQQGKTILASGYTSDALIENVQAATSINVTSSTYSLYKYAAAFGRINYILKEKYILNLTGRRDGSSRFGPGKQFGNFGAVGAAWIFSNENFIKEHLSFLSFGKLRMSYGKTGSDAIGNYQYLDTYSSTSFGYNGTKGLALTRLNNPNYSWESNTKLEAGIEGTVLKNILSFSVSWYQNRSTNQLVGLPLPVITGQSSIQYNLPATVQNKGWEFQISTVNISRDKLKWTSSVNFTIPKNVLLKFPNLAAFPAYNNIFQVGSSTSPKRTLINTGVDPVTGLYTFKDLDNDGSISTSNDGVFSKKVVQQYYGGLNNSITWHNFQIDVFFQFVKQTGLNYVNFFDSPGSLTNQPTIVMNRWRESGNHTSIERATLTDEGYNAYVNYKFSDKAISDASFIRLKNVSISWRFPFDWANARKIDSFRIFVQGQNLFTITNFLGMDPENQNVGFLPPLRVITGGVKVTL